MRISSLFKWLRRWSSQAFRKRHSPAAFRTWRNAGNSVLTVEGTTSKGTGSISCEAEFCIFYRLSLKTLWTKDVQYQVSLISVIFVWFWKKFTHFIISNCMLWASVIAAINTHYNGLRPSMWVYILATASTHVFCQKSFYYILSHIFF
jgi:hypothetical protein